MAALVAGASRVLAIGAQSSVTGGATPDGGLILSTDRLAGLREDGASHVRAGAGVPLQALQAWLADRGRWYPPVPTFAGAFVGGVVATNAAGAATFKYGATRAWVDGLTVVLSCGDVIDLVRGQIVADSHHGFEIVCAHGTRHVRPGTYRMPAVPKCSAGYFAAPEMDLIDLFIGSEGTIGVVTEATLRVQSGPPPVAFVLVPARTEAQALAIVSDLREASARTWTSHDARGIDVAAIEHLDRRCLELLREDGADRACGVRVPIGTDVVLLAQVELPVDTRATAAYDEIAGAFSDEAADAPLVRLCRLLDRHGVFESSEIALPGDARRARELLAFREAAPTAVNRRVGDAKRTVDARIEKTAADMIVPFEHFAEMMDGYRDGYERRGLDYAIWGHISDGNVHPNVVPHAYADVVAGRDAILEFGRAVARLGGCPLAEHGVGRSAIKQALLRQLYGDEAIDQMRAIKRALDPDTKLAPGVIFGGR